MAIIKCPNCGRQLSDTGGGVCPTCGTSVSEIVAWRNSQKKEKKRGCAGCLVTALAVIGAFVVISIIGMFLFSGNTNKSNQSSSKSSSHTIEKPKSSDSKSSGSQSAAFSDNPQVGVPNPPPSKTQASSGNLGDYNVKIKEAFTTTDYEGNPAIVVTYSWTNNSDETKSAMWALVEKAFQDGIQLDSAIIVNSDIFDSNSSMTEIKPGKTLDVQAAFSLRNSSSDVDIEISEFLGFDDKIVSTTFSIRG